MRVPAFCAGSSYRMLKNVIPAQAGIQNACRSAPRARRMGNSKFLGKTNRRISRARNREHALDTFVNGRVAVSVSARI
jgi:hypothetical protein